MKVLLLLLTVLISPMTAALIPLPREIKETGGTLLIDGRMIVVAGQAEAGPAEVLTKALLGSTGFAHRVKNPQRVGRMNIKRAIWLVTAAEGLKPQGYRLEITKENITVTGADLAGLMNGTQTLAQMLPLMEKPQGHVSLPCQVITDWPDLERRAFFLDVSSHLFPTEDLKKLIDLLAFHKLNELHLLLNNDHGWRMESKVYPKLHEIGSKRASTPPPGNLKGSDGKEYGGYYPQEKLRELVTYAASREMKIVPAFSFFKGASAMVAAYPELGEPGTKVKTTWEEFSVGLKSGHKTRNFLAPLLAEIAEIFPSDVIRLESLPAERKEAIQLRRLLVPQKRKIIDGSKMRGVDFSIYGIPEAAELLIDPRRKASAGLLTSKDIYGMKVGVDSEAFVQTRLISKYQKLEYTLLPRIASYAEVMWLPQEKKSYDDFRTRAREMSLRYRDAGISSAEFYEPPEATTLGGTKVTSSMKGRELHWPELVFDGKRETFFWSEEGLEKGDHLTIEFPWIMAGDLEIATGRQGGDAASVLGDGVLETSLNGKDWDAVAEFFDGLVTTTLKAGTRFVRLRVTTAQDDPLIIYEVKLSESLLMPEHEETLTFQIKRDDEIIEIPLTFRADFSAVPSARTEVSAMRRAFFGNWIFMTNMLGVAQNTKVKKDFFITLLKDPNLSEADASDLAMEKMAKELATYGPGTPDWYRKGMIAFLRRKLVPTSTFAMTKSDGKPVREAILTEELAASEFLFWMQEKLGHSFTLLSQDCIAGRYQEASWKKLTGKTLDELITDFRAGK